MPIKIEKYNCPSNDTLTLECIKGLFSPTDDYVYRKNSYNPEEYYSGLSRSMPGVHILFVIQGSCEFWEPSDPQKSRVEVSAGEKMIGFSTSLAFQVTSQSKFEFVTVRELPDHLKGQGIR